MIGFRGVHCAVTKSRFGQAPQASPFWLANCNLRYNGQEDCLGECTFTGLDEPITNSTHREDAGVVCLSGEKFNASLTHIYTNCDYILQW